MDSDQNMSSQPISASQAPPATTGPVYSGLSGNEMYCMSLLGYRPGNLLVGNSVFSMGLLGGLKSIAKGVMGGEIHSFTQMISEGRRLSYQRLAGELDENQGLGMAGVTSELVFHGTNIEFLSMGSALHATGDAPKQRFTTAFDGQELFCLEDSGYTPVSFVFGNVAYSIGVGRGITGAFRQLAKGEVKQYSDIFTNTRQLALKRVVDDAKLSGANSVVGIRTNILPLGTSGVQEMVMVGTAANHPQATGVNSISGVITSDLTAEETWSMAKLGYMPMELVLGTSVYSLGFIGGVASFFSGMVKGEIRELTEMVYGAREESLGKLQAQAAELGADDVLGVKVYIYQLGGSLIEFLAIGTAVKKVKGLATKSDVLPPQAIIRDKNTFVNTVDRQYGVDLNNQAS